MEKTIFLSGFSKDLKRIPHLDLISRLAKSKNNHVWLVGGYLRDLWLKKKKAKDWKKLKLKDKNDFDFCIANDSHGFACAFAKKVKSRCIVLDKSQGSFRVVVKNKDRYLIYDFTRLRGSDLVEDLLSRDFVINTLSVDLVCKDFKIADYLGATKDLANKSIRMASRRSFDDDPLRILRGFSFFANYRFKISPAVFKLMSKKRKLLNKVSKERIAEELYKIFKAESSYSAIKKLDDLKILIEVIPEIAQAKGVRQGRFHHLDVWRHSLETLKMFELLITKKFLKNIAVWDYLNCEIAQGRTRFQIIKLACLLHDIGKPAAKAKKGKKTIFYMHEKIGCEITDKISRDLRFSFKESELLKKLIFWHLRPGYLADQVNPSQRAVYRFYRDAQGEGVGVILLSLADWWATRGPLTDLHKRKIHEKIMINLIRQYFRRIAFKPIPKLIDGYIVMKKFKIKPSQLIGKVLKAIREEQALRRILTKAQALRFAGQIIKGKKH